MSRRAADPAPSPRAVAADRAGSPADIDPSVDVASLDPPVPLPLTRVAVIAKPGSRDAVETALELGEWLQRRGHQVALDEATLRNTRVLAGFGAFVPRDGYDLVVVLGGDGTLLSVGRTLTNGSPLLGVNLGTLGFLTEINRVELYPAMVEVLNGRFSLEERSLLEVEVERAAGGTARYRVLNDAVIAKSALSRIIELHLNIDGSVVARFRADGLIISTPTGSTAYNLSAGGPVIVPHLPVAVLNPICPHTLSLRPLVVPDGARIEVSLETVGEEVYLTLDGQEGTTLDPRDVVRVTCCPSRVRLVRVSGRSFYDSLRGKLRWGG